MADVQTTVSAISAALTFKVQRGVLQNLRARLVYADPAYAQQGVYDPGHNQLMFVNVPDLGINVTPLTEGARPSKRALTMGTITISPTQYGDLVSITDLTRVLSPFEIVPTATERLSREAAESIDQVARDAIAAGGTVYYADAVASRAALGATNLLDATDLRTLKTKMQKAKIPAFPDGYYRLWVAPDVEFDLRNDTTTAGAFVDVNKYATPDTILRGEVGRLEGFRIQGIVNAPTFASTVTVYASLALGDIKGWGTGDLQTLRTYHVAPGGDHTDPLAQEELMGWKVDFGVAVLSNSYFFRVESAATVN